ncbi:MAG: TrkA-N domain protein [Parcubacteria group bacterium GW2011_GWF2_38_76]|nr:MAG: TrkA-N domain protein [Parcubacteria group bacterium GW2011_GWF2_38_76]HBM45497.1 hypothetical protein [Patescibacteria group bacterium]
MSEFLVLIKETIEKLLVILKDPKKIACRVRIITSHWDPDSIACVVLMQSLLRFFGFKSVEVYIPGKPDNFVQNAEIVNHFGLRNVISQLKEDFTNNLLSDDLLIFVDTPNPNDSRFPNSSMIRPHIVIDHHARPGEMVERNENEWYLYYSCGACVSILTALMIELDVFKSMNDRELRNIATLATLGILADTRKLTTRHTKPIDCEMLAFLSKYSDQETIEQISSSNYSEAFLDALGIQRNRWERKGNILLFRAESSDSIQGAEDNMIRITELLMGLREVKTLYVWALQGDKIFIKARNSDKSIDLNSELKRIFGDKNGGAKDKSSGGALLDVGILSEISEENRDNLLLLCKAYMHKKIFGK